MKGNAPASLTRRGVIVAGLLIGLALLFAPAEPAHAATAPVYPRCITTTWASTHYHQPKTARGVTCIVHGTNGPARGSVGFGGATVSAFTPDYYPSTWPTVGVLTNRNGDVAGLLVRRPR